MATVSTGHHQLQTDGQVLCVSLSSSVWVSACVCVVREGGREVRHVCILLGSLSQLKCLRNHIQGG